MQRRRKGRAGPGQDAGPGEACLSLVPPQRSGPSVTPRAFPFGAGELGWSAGHPQGTEMHITLACQHRDLGVIAACGPQQGSNGLFGEEVQGH